MNSAERATYTFIATALADVSRTLGIYGVGTDFRITEPRRRVMVRVAFDFYRRVGIRACRGCACTDAMACDGGCSWAGPELCSACVPRKRKRRA